MPLPTAKMTGTEQTGRVDAERPFARYPDGGRSLLGRPRWGDGTARHSYGLQVHEWCGFRCAYCGLDLGTFEGWLQLSVDHVVPQQMVGAGYTREWVEDTINIVAACGACNGLFNRDPGGRRRAFDLRRVPGDKGRALHHEEGADSPAPSSGA